MYMYMQRTCNHCTRGECNNSYKQWLHTLDAFWNSYSNCWIQYTRPHSCSRSSLSAISCLTFHTPILNVSSLMQVANYLYQLFTYGTKTLSDSSLHWQSNLGYFKPTCYMYENDCHSILQARQTFECSKQTLHHILKSAYHWFLHNIKAGQISETAIRMHSHHVSTRIRITQMLPGLCKAD